MVTLYTAEEVEAREQKAYQQGFGDDADHQNLPCKYPDVDEAWNAYKEQQDGIY